MEICNDKNKMKKYFHNTSFIPSKIGKKIIIKPRIGRGSKNQIVVDDKSNIFFNFFSKNKDFTIEKYNEVKEY